MYLGFGLVWEYLQVIVIIFTVIVKIYSIVFGRKHIAELRNLFVSYLFSHFFNLVLTD